MIKDDPGKFLSTRFYVHKVFSIKILFILVPSIIFDYFPSVPDFFNDPDYNKIQFKYDYQQTTPEPTKKKIHTKFNLKPNSHHLKTKNSLDPPRRHIRIKIPH